MQRENRVITAFASIHAALAVVSNLLLLSLFELRSKGSGVRITPGVPPFQWVTESFLQQLAPWGQFWGQNVSLTTTILPPRVPVKLYLAPRQLERSTVFLRLVLPRGLVHRECAGST